MQLELFPRAKVRCDYGVNNRTVMSLHTAIDFDTASSDSYDGGTTTTAVSDIPDSLVGRSPSIPLPSSHVTRTRSEIQLCLDTEEARQRDLDMFYRLVNGLRARHASDQNRIPAYHIGTERQPERQLPESLAHYRYYNTTSLPMFDESVEETLFDFDQSLPERNSVDNIDSWSITGFDDGATTGNNIAESDHVSEQSLLGTAECNDEDNSGVFELDL